MKNAQHRPRYMLFPDNVPDAFYHEKPGSSPIAMLKEEAYRWIVRRGFDYDTIRRPCGFFTTTVAVGFYDAADMWSFYRAFGGVGREPTTQ